MNSRQIRKRMHSMEMARRKARKEERRYLSLLRIRAEMVAEDIARGEDFAVEFRMEPLLKHEG